MMCQMMGRSPIWTSGFGTRSVSSRSRVPSPPARMTTGMSSVGVSRRVIRPSRADGGGAPAQAVVEPAVGDQRLDALDADEALRQEVVHVEVVGDVRVVRLLHALLDRPPRLQVGERRA